MAKKKIKNFIEISVITTSFIVFAIIKAIIEAVVGFFTLMGLKALWTKVFKKKPDIETPEEAVDEVRAHSNSDRYVCGNSVPASNGRRTPQKQTRKPDTERNC